MRVGFIGLGSMGAHMARNLLHAGFDVTVHDVRAESATEHLALGATLADTAAECAAAVDVLITMLPDPRTVELVMLRAGAAAALRPDALWVDMSTSTAQTARLVGEVLDVNGARRLDAPVSGMSAGAAAGILQIFVGGELADFHRVLPLFEAIGDPNRVLHVGGLGAGYTVKLMINLLWFAHLVATSEVLAIGVKSGVDLATLHRSLQASPANSHFLANDVLSIFSAGDYDEGFALKLACKDLGLAVDAGRDIGVSVELSALVEQIYRRARTVYGDAAGEMTPVRLYESLAGQPFRFAEPPIAAGDDTHLALA
ncbi:MAG TPA: NAD(P)-dependent oxidoreductase [Pseudonocardiaceae bacterium]